MVTNSFADYVFSDNYDLKNIEEVEKYIKKYKHLPNIPSACEVEEQGLDMGEILRLQMEKIEELTLHLINLNKEIQILKTNQK